VLADSSSQEFPRARREYAITDERPSLAIDLFSDETIQDPHPVYRAVRDRASAVWLPLHDVWAIGRHSEVRAALRAEATLVSGRGVGLTALINDQPGRTTLMSDGDLHRRRRGVLMKPMMPSALKQVRPRVDELAHALVEDLLARETFDGIADFSRHLPVAVVSHLVGLPEEGREHMLDWAAATFDALGPRNARAQAAGPTLVGMIQYAIGVDRARLPSDGWAAQLFDAVDEGKLDAEDAPGLLIDYIAPSLDTTILGTGHLLYLLGTNPEQYDRVRESPELIPSAVGEVLRIGSPVRGFTRYALSPYEAEGVSIPQGDRVLILYGAANRDERRYEDADRFDVKRDTRDHVAFGHGVHRCAGAHLAQLEMEALLRALVSKVRSIEVGEPRVLMSNMLQGYQSFSASFR
jgi:cytochrome P450